MTAPIKMALTPEAQRRIASLQTLPARVRSGLLHALDEQNQLTVAHIDEDYLSGPRPSRLGVVSNRLRGSIRASEAALLSTGTITSSIGTNVSGYPAFHEYGFHGTVQVAQYLRRVFKYSRKQPGARISKKTGKIIEPKKTRTETGQAIVKAHSRKIDYDGRPFLRPGVNDRRAEYMAALSGVFKTNFDQQEGGAS